MSLNTALFNLISTAVGHTRVHPSTETVTVSSNFPKVIYTRIATVRRYCDDGNSGLTQARYQLDIFADKVSTAESIADQIRIALDGYSGTSDSTTILRISFDSENFSKGEKQEGANKTPARYSQDLICEYRESVS
jgi:hypothetical protein